MRTSAVALLLLLALLSSVATAGTASTTAGKTNVVVPDVETPPFFFRALPDESGRLRLAVQCPKRVDPESMQREIGWWWACAKAMVLRRPDRLGGNRVYREAWQAAEAEVAALDPGELTREELRNAVREIARRHHLDSLLADLELDPRIMPSEIADLRRAMAEARGIDLDDPRLRSPAERLVFWCPDKGDVLALDGSHWLYPYFEKLMTEAEWHRKWNAMNEAFGQWASSHPEAGIDERTAHARRLARSVVQACVELANEKKGGG